MTYATIEDGESAPLQDGGYSDNTTSTKNKYASSAIVRTVMVGATVTGALLLLIMAGPSKMMLTNSSSSTGVTAIEGRGGSK